MFTPSVSVNGWSAGGHTVVEVVTDDMPFLVDSVSMALAEEQHDIHLVIHPQFVVRRDLGGQLHEVLDEQASVEEHDVARESWMHLEIDRVSEDQLEEIHDLLTKVLTDVRDAVEDWERMHAQIERIVEDLDEHPPPLPDDGGRAGHRRCCGGSRTTTSPSSATASTSSRPRTTARPWSPCPAPASGSCAPTRRHRECCPRRSPREPATSTCSCWPRPTRGRPCTAPCYLDYVGVKKFDDER